MAINRVDYPANLTAQADFSAHGELIETRYMDQVNAPQWVVSGNIPQGVVLQIGGVVYRADSDTAITGTASDYVKITPSGATAAAAYVADLTGVTWSAQYNGYYDASDNLYLFDEGKALAAGEIASVFGRYLMQQPNGDVHIGGKVATGSGGGLSEVHPMDQSVRTTDSVTFGSMTGYVRPANTFSIVNATQNQVFDALSPAIPTVGNVVGLFGGAADSDASGSRIYCFSHAERTSSTEITIYHIRFLYLSSSSSSGIGSGTNVVVNGSTTQAFSRSSFSW